MIRPMETPTPTQIGLVSDAITKQYAALAAEQRVYLDRAAKHESCGRHEDYREHCLEQAEQLTATMATLDDAHQVICWGMSLTHPEPQVVDLVAALRASVDAAKARREQVQS